MLVTSPPGLSLNSSNRATIPQFNQLQKAKAQQPAGTSPSHVLRTLPTGEAGSHDDNEALSQPQIEQMQVQAVSSGDSEEQLDEEAVKGSNVIPFRVQTLILNFKAPGTIRNGCYFKVEEKYACYDQERMALTVDVKDEKIFQDE